mmetsp:Transcript_49552/g.91397  ORF Transcript_49552/g.91397 Transcript_49552/m.91397 type:complete len:108 (-) Transcript_49552:1436-1759(-)
MTVPIGNLTHCTKRSARYVHASMRSGHWRIDTAKSGSLDAAVVPLGSAVTVTVPPEQLLGSVQPEASHQVVLYPVVSDGKVQRFILVQPSNANVPPSVEQAAVAEPV